MNVIEKAFQFALNKHEGQFRKATGIPYITHPFAVSMILKHHQYSDDVVAAGLLHDTLEDTETTAEELQGTFGDKILKLIEAASEEDTSLPWEDRKRMTIKELPFKTVDQVAVVVADKLHNLRSIQADINTLGEAVWSRFNRGKREQSWYYMSIVNALKPFGEEMRLVRILDVEVKRLFVGTGQLTNEKIDLLFDVAYHLSLVEETKFAELGMVYFVSELTTAAEALYKNGDFEFLNPLMADLEERGIQFEMNSDGTFMLLTFCYELKHRLGWSNEDLYAHLKRNLNKL